LNLSIENIGKIIEELLCTDINLKTKRGDKRIYLEQLFAKIILIKRGA
jgi:DNA polymerase III delta subunit